MIARGSLTMLLLLRRGWLVRRARRRLLRSCRPRRHTALPTVETGVIDRGVIHHRLRVGVVNVGDIHVAYLSVVIKLLALPMSPTVTLAVIAKAVINSAVEPDRGTPVAAIPRISAVAPAPVPRGPQQTNRRRLYPGPGDPKVALLLIIPITGGPDPALLDKHRLLIHRQRRRSDGNGDRDLRRGNPRDGHNGQTQRQCASRPEQE